MRGTMNDRDMMQCILDQSKHSATFLTSFILESSNQGLRQELMQLLNNVLQEQYHCYEMMHQRGWYQPMPADPNTMTAAQQAVTSAFTQTGGANPMGMQMGNYPMMGYEHMATKQTGMSGSQATMGSSQPGMGTSQSGMGMSQA